MAKLTRKYYKRKKIAFAAVILGGVALVSSGFAAWVLSANATKDATGVTTVGQVKDASLTIEVQLQYKDLNSAVEKWDNQDGNGSFVFEPTKDDVSKPGQRVYNDGKNFERLTLRYVVTVSSLLNSAFDSLNVKMIESDSKNGIQQAVEKKYIAEPEEFKEAGVTISSTSDKFNVDDQTKQTNGVCTWTLNYDLTLQWGEKFAGMNPGKYYDENEVGKNVPLKNENLSSEEIAAKKETVESVLGDLHTLLDGVSYTLTFTASAK